ncbi:MAG: glycogen-binding domain-containing protein [Gemmatimonadaceae bacterium]|nr:glycogen-binding domain-containing protein [Gemmatimonadaceae bacterium]
MIRARRAALGLVLLGAPVTGGAQAVSDLRVEAGFASVKQRGFDAENAVLLAALWRRPSEAFTLLTSANLTYAADSLAAAQGVAALDIPWNVSERLRTEVGVAGASFSLRSAGRGGNVNAFARQHFVGLTGGAFGGFALAGTNRDDVSSRSWLADLGAWYRWEHLYLSGTVTRRTSSDWPLLLASGVFRNPDDERYELLDAQVLLQARNGPHDFTLSFTQRDGIGGTNARFQALSASGTLQFTERVAILASGGRQLADPLRGLPQADLLTVSMRLSLGSKPLPVMQRSAIASAEVIRQVGGGGELVVRVFASDTMLVDVAGDFSDWRPVQMQREGSFWVARVPLRPGKYRVAVRVNLGPWRAPRNLARVRDDYGGESGLVVVP